MNNTALRKQLGFITILPLLIGTVSLTSLSAATTIPQELPQKLVNNLSINALIDKMRVTVPNTDIARAKISIEITRQRLDEIKKDTTPTLQHLKDAQSALDNAVSALIAVENSYNKNDNSITKEELSALLTEFLGMVSDYQDMFSGLEKTPALNEQTRPFTQKLELVNQLARNDREDLQDDSRLNASVLNTIVITVNGIVELQGDTPVLQIGNKKLTLRNALQNKNSFINKPVTIDGFIQRDNPQEIQVITIKLQDSTVPQNRKIELKGSVKQFASLPILMAKDSEKQYILVADEQTTNPFINKLVLTTGEAYGNVVVVKEIAGIVLTPIGKPKDAQNSDSVFNLNKTPTPSSQE